MQLHPEQLCSLLSTLSTPSAPLATSTTQTVFKSDADMGQVELVEELTLRIQCDPIGQAPPFNTKSLTIKGADSYHSPQWQVVMTRVNNGGCDSKLDIQLRCPSSYSRLLPATFRSVNVVYHQHHLASIPLSESAFSNWGELKLSFPVEKALNGNRYEFDIILSTQAQLVESPKMAPLLSSSSTSSSMYTTPKSSSTNPSMPSPLSRRINQSQAMMKMFLRDRHSVDVQFLLYPTDGEQQQYGPKNIGPRLLPSLWAHRIVVSRHPSFAALIREATSATQVCQTKSLTIPVYGFSLAAFSCLMYFLYTGNVQLVTHPDFFALSEVDVDEAFLKHECLPTEPDTVMIGPQNFTDIHPFVELSCKPTVEWGLQDASSYWPVKGVTCREIFTIAKHFGISDLQEMCLEGMVESIDATNVVEMLFEFGGSNVLVREAGLAFMSDNLSVLFADGEDPFVGYRDREECYVIMVEVMRSFTKRLQVVSSCH
ncbi:hypothetical protein BGZ95_005513 [Linnemannia exigua]|uniref:BTB domain-containing protein n=1 Tax=Linnemannia exigua TaxID=604196 RepID=A0AAD4H7N9_9FUNG|nr:hypothetical protein BGZ95_005513 [Linnemannia exigua]